MKSVSREKKKLNSAQIEIYYWLYWNILLIIKSGKDNKSIKLCSVPHNTILFLVFFDCNFVAIQFK